MKSTLRALWSSKITLCTSFFCYEKQFLTSLICCKNYKILGAIINFFASITSVPLFYKKSLHLYTESLKVHSICTFQLKLHHHWRYVMIVNETPYDDDDVNEYYRKKKKCIQNSEWTFPFVLFFTVVNL